MAFTRATRKRVFFKMALTGPSGAGKTLSALMIAQGLGGKDAKIAVIDSENDSASLYSDRIGFDACPISAPFTVQKYMDAIREAVDAGYDVLVIDSLTHAWAGEGGLLSQKETLDARGGNSFTNWAGITKQQEAFKGALLQSPIHIISTMRSKQDYAVETGANGKSTPKKVGLAPIQREGMEYEFSTVLDIGVNHEAFVSKDRTGLFDGVVGTLTSAHGKQIREWLESGEATPESDTPVAVPTKEEQDAARDKFLSAADKIGLTLRPGPDCGKWANRSIGRPVESREKFTLDDWKRAAQGIEEAFNIHNQEGFKNDAAPSVQAADSPVKPEPAAKAEPAQAAAAAPSAKPTAALPLDDSDGLEDPFAE